ncbi:MAG: acetate uptake transporter family protein [Rhodanobacteraceae bacterium]
MNKLANASGLGYAVFALTLWLASMEPAGWFDPSGAALAPLLFARPGDVLLPLLVAVLGGGVLALAGIGQYLRGHMLDSVLFLAFAGYWWIAALTRHALDTHAFAPTTGFLGWYYITWAFLAFCIWLAALGDDIARMLFTLGLCVALLVFALASWIHVTELTVLGGYFGLVTAVVGIYIAAAEIINGTRGHVVFPLGESLTGSRPNHH